MKAGGSFKSLRLSLKSPGKRVLWNRGVHLEPCNNNPTTETVSEDHATCSSCALLFEPNNADLATEPVQDEAYPAHDPPPYSPRPFRYRPLFGQGDGPELETSYVQNLSLVAAQAWMPIVKGTRETDTADTQTVRRWLTYFSMKVAMKIVLQCPVMVCWHRVLNDLCIVKHIDKELLLPDVLQILGIYESLWLGDENCTCLDETSCNRLPVPCVPC